MRAAAFEVGARLRRLRAWIKSPVVQFALAALTAIAVVGLISAYLLNRTGHAEAIRDALRTTTFAGEGIVEPAVTERLIAEDPHAIRRMDAIVKDRVLDRGGIIRVKIWDAESRIVYSD